ncbi:transcriptional regulator BetI [Klebsiella pneumoniae]|uniref:Transcriptional regulator BetI n=1 Tax=Klebsiella pneumoniae TaxID=573 RepID=A0A2X1RKL1_KLEPN|nr:transcriptional regulator BetI [Klebsiella pneumoniae]
MPKLGMQPIRRRQLIDATLDAINEVGMHDATIAQIARRAGVSTGIISHYFKDKNGLLEATMRDITSQLRDAVLNRLHALRTAAPASVCRRLSAATLMRRRSAARR